MRQKIYRLMRPAAVIMSMIMGSTLFSGCAPELLEEAGRYLASEQAMGTERQEQLKIADVAIGMESTVYLSEDGTVYAWGQNTYGEAGNGTTAPCLTPEKILEDVTAIHSNGKETYGAITETGELYMWGRNDVGQVGNGTSENCLAPELILQDVTFLDMTDRTCGAITESGDLYMWGVDCGTGEETACLAPKKILEKIAYIDIKNTCGAITETGDLYMWGNNRDGQIGNGTGEMDVLVPVKILDHVKSVCVGDTCGAITELGDLYMWGFNRGRIGNGETENCLVPEKILENVVEFDFGKFMCGAITANGDLYTWGSFMTGTGELDAEKFTPKKVLENVRQVSLNEVCGALTESGELYMWGENSYGQVGNGTKEKCPTPVKVLENVSDFYLDGETVSTAITNTGELYMWGRTVFQIDSWAKGDYTLSLMPKRIFEGAGSCKLFYDAGSFGWGFTTIAILADDGSLYMMGTNEGRLGDGTKDNRSEPIKIL